VERGSAAKMSCAVALRARREERSAERTSVFVGCGAGEAVPVCCVAMSWSWVESADGVSSLVRKEFSQAASPH